MKKESILVRYTGKKTVQATPMTLGEFKEYSGRDPYAGNQETLDDDAEGFLVVYPDGYESWSPKKVFQDAYMKSETFVDRLEIELKELNEKACKLDKFISGNDGFQKLGRNEQQLLYNQLFLMNNYARILQTRLNYHKPIKCGGCTCEVNTQDSEGENMYDEQTDKKQE